MPRAVCTCRVAKSTGDMRAVRNSTGRVLCAHSVAGLLVTALALVLVVLLLVVLVLVVVLLPVVVRLLLVHSHHRRARLVLRSLRGVARLDLAPARRQRRSTVTAATPAAVAAAVAVVAASVAVVAASVPAVVALVVVGAPEALRGWQGI